MTVVLFWHFSPNWTRTKFFIEKCLIYTPRQYRVAYFHLNIWKSSWRQDHFGGAYTLFLTAGMLLFMITI